MADAEAFLAVVKEKEVSVPILIMNHYKPKNLKTIGKVNSLNLLKYVIFWVPF